MDSFDPIEVRIHPCEFYHSLKHFNVHMCNLMNAFVLCSLPLFVDVWIVRALAVYEIYSMMNVLLVQV